MQPEFWNDKRPAGVPDSLDFGAYRSVVEVFERWSGPGHRPPFQHVFRVDSS